VSSELQFYAEKACNFWGGCNKLPKLIKHRENAVFGVILKNNIKAALRLHRPGYKDLTEIKSEMWWTKALAKKGFPVPCPIESHKGEDVIQVSSDLVATMIEWVEGAPIGDAKIPIKGSGKKIYFELGMLLADLHNLTEDLNFPDWFKRPLWDIDGLLGETPNWGRFWESSGLSQEEKYILKLTRNKVKLILQKYKFDGAETLLLHGDAIRENVFNGPNGLTLIDFDDCGYGFPIYDLATATIQSIEDKHYQNRCDAILNGYGKDRYLTDADFELFPIFSMLRVLATSSWIISRVKKGSSVIDIYKQRALKEAKKFLEK
jgi:Ser/Thr protein kinase RdoA (MazF antagonist)